MMYVINLHALDRQYNGEIHIIKSHQSGLNMTRNLENMFFESIEFLAHKLMLFNENWFVDSTVYL